MAPQSAGVTLRGGATRWRIIHRAPLQFCVVIALSSLLRVPLSSCEMSRGVENCRRECFGGVFRVHLSISLSSLCKLSCYVRCFHHNVHQRPSYFSADFIMVTVIFHV